MIFKHTIFPWKPEFLHSKKSVTDVVNVPWSLFPNLCAISHSHECWLKTSPQLVPFLEHDSWQIGASPPKMLLSLAKPDPGVQNSDFLPGKQLILHTSLPLILGWDKTPSKTTPILCSNSCLPCFPGSMCLKSTKWWAPEFLPQTLLLGTQSNRVKIMPGFVFILCQTWVSWCSWLSSS
jgi:hypothetical protein